MNKPSHQQLHANLAFGHVYRRENLLRYSKAVDRDLEILVRDGRIEKVAAGIYYKPQHSKYGTLPPDDDDLIKTFLRDDQYLMLSWNAYNSLGLGLTQLYNRIVVYNYKRHCKCELGDRKFDFRRPARGFPKKITKEYLLVDLVNNLRLLAEDSSAVKAAIQRRFNKFDTHKVLQLANKYGKVSTQHFFEGLI